MKRLTAYCLNGKKEEFIERLRTEKFRTGVNGNYITSFKECCNLCLGFILQNDCFYVYSIERMNSAEIAERSRLLKLADDFKTD